MMTATKAPANKGTSGALNALANYWIKKALYDNMNETSLVPECNLEYGANEAFGQFLFGQELDATVAFELGLQVAGILIDSPLDAGDAIRELLTEAIEEAAAAGKPKRDVASWSDLRTQ